ncbi:kinesin family member C3 S homeolog isoform X1 [Xenopus laevis]|uniref:Kinesin-like protein n=3 Tax=Xenopus laevis TaxID=8355 RepID=A0A8J1MZA3_XENLA|nr:kinesin family member C3 S homeolog isoform X1 [Xenopus laevis]
MEGQVCDGKMEGRKPKSSSVALSTTRSCPCPMKLQTFSCCSLSHSFSSQCWIFRTTPFVQDSLKHSGWWLAVGKICSSTETMVGTLSELLQDTHEVLEREDLQEESTFEKPTMQDMRATPLQRSMKVTLQDLRARREAKDLQEKKQPQVKQEQHGFRDRFVNLHLLRQLKDSKPQQDGDISDSRQLQKRLMYLQKTKDLHEQSKKGKGQVQENCQDHSGVQSGLQIKLKELQGKLEQKEREHEEVQRQVKEMNSLQVQVGGTDLEKHRDLLVSENDRLRKELQLLNSHLGTGKKLEVEALKERLTSMEQRETEHKLLISALQREVQQKAERLAEAELRLRDSARERVEEEERLNRMLREYQLCNQPQIKYMVKTVEVDSAKTKVAFGQLQSRNVYLEEQVDLQREALQKMQQQVQLDQQEVSKLRAQVKLYDLELDKAQAQMVQEYQSLQVEKEQAVAEAFEKAQGEMRAVHQSLDGVRKNLLTLQPALRTLTHDYNALKRQVRDFPALLNEAMGEARLEFSQAVKHVSDANAELLHKYRKELHLRKECNNQLVRLRGNIRVFARVRPITTEDGVGPGAENIVTFDPDDDGVLYVAQKGKEMSFELDKIFTPSATQEEVFRDVSPLITSCLDGYSVCILAYGQTGSGKTYSMEGIPSDPGINQRALRLLLSEVKERSSSWEHELSVSMVEIYNESLRDLLGSDPSNSLEIKILPGSVGELYVPNLTQRQVQSMEDINKILELGHKQRATEHTNLNTHSSRSHALLILTAKGRETSTGICSTGKLYLVDLAGSERVSRSGAAGERLREAQCINRSLSALGDVISALRSQQGHIPYRNSKLTYLLQEPLSREGKALLLLQVSPAEKNISESLCSLRFGDRVRAVELGAPSRKIEQPPPNAELAESESPVLRSTKGTSLRRKPQGSVRQRTSPP